MCAACGTTCSWFGGLSVQAGGFVVCVCVCESVLRVGEFGAVLGL